MDEIVKRNLIKFYEENKNLLKLEISFDDWDKQDDETIIISSNNSIKGSIVFKIKYYEVKKLSSMGIFTTKTNKIEGLTFSDYYHKLIQMYHNGYYFPYGSNGKKLFKNLYKLIDNNERDNLNYIKETDKKNKETDKKNEEIRLENLNKSKTNLLKEFDDDGNGIIDVIEGQDDFMTLFKKHQNKVIEVDKNYIQHFVKVSNYLKTKRENIQNIFSSIKDTTDQSQLEEHVGLLKNQIHTYELLLFHSLNMITSVVEDDLITFYEIYESFDKLKIFKSDHENEVSQQLNDIGDGLNNLMYSINDMERSMVNGLNELNYTTQEGFHDLNTSVTRELSSIDSSIKFNNLLTGIQTYQMYKVNKKLS